MQEIPSWDKLPLLERSINSVIITKLMAFYKLTINDILKMSIYQILILFVDCLKIENERLFLMESFKAWINPTLYQRLHREYRRNDFFSRELEHA